VARNLKGERTMMIRKRLAGKVQYNDGQFVEIQTVGTEGLEKSLLMETIQVDRSETADTPEQFQHRFPGGMWLEIWTTMEFRSHDALNPKQATSVVGTGSISNRGVGAPHLTRPVGFTVETHRTPAEKHAMVRHHLEAAVRSQRESWDEALVVQDIAGNHDRDIYAFVAELAGGLKDDEAIPEEIIETLISTILEIESGPSSVQ
jgi:hypothetical protein